jgi:hypothetical protein
MDKYVFFISSLISISILAILFWFVIVKFSKDQESEFVVNYRVLTDVIELYKESILLNKIHTLETLYDLNEKSKTNSRQAFEKAKNELISETVKEIIKDYLSEECVSSLLRHYSVDGLSLLIITHLKR